MNRFVFGIAILGVIAGAAGVRAEEPIGIPACDNFLTKYDACLSSHVPAEYRGTFKSSIDQTRSAWTAIAKNPSAKPSLETACARAIEQAKTSMAAYNCGF